VQVVQPQLEASTKLKKMITHKVRRAF